MSLWREKLAANLPRSRLQIGLGALGGLCLVVLLLLLPSGEQLPDMRDYAAGSERKAAFFDFLAPVVERQNAAILQDRQKLLEIVESIDAGKSPSLLQRLKIKSLAKKYGLDPENTDSAGLAAQLLRRADAVPLPLALVQAAKESGWGTSRFAREANNLFGHWCFRAGCGVVPVKRAEGARHEVRRFDSVEDAVAAYLHNINTGDGYRRLRDIRAAQRRAGEKPNAMALADGLLFYSQRREAYVNEVKKMVHQYMRFAEQRSA